MNPYRFALVGAGWRAEFFFRIAAALPERFQIAGGVVRDAEKGRRVEERWGHATYRALAGLLEAVRPEFLVGSVAYGANYEVNRALIRQAQNFPGHERRIIEAYRNNQSLMASLRAPIFEEKVVDFIIEMANVKDREVSVEELLRDPDAAGEGAPAKSRKAKRPAAKKAAAKPEKASEKATDKDKPKAKPKAKAKSAKTKE